MKPRKRKDWIFDDFFRDFEEEFREMEEDIARLFDEARKMPKSGEAKRPFIYGFSVNMGPDGEPNIERFSNLPDDGDRPPVDEGPTPLMDVIESDHEVKVVAEIPGVNREDIVLNATEDSLDIKVDTASKVFHELVGLPVKVKPDVSRASYKNGVLEVVLTRLEGRKDTSVRVDVK